MYKISIFIIIILASTSVFAQNKKTNKKNLGKSTFSQSIIEESSEISTKKNSELIGMIKGFQLVIKNEQNQSKRLDFILSQSSAYLALVRNYRLSSQGPQTARQKKNEDTSLIRVVKNTELVLSMKSATVEQKARALYYSGIVNSYKGDLNKASDFFLKAIAMQPTAKWAPSVSIFVAENYFDNEKYEQAIKQYKVYYNKYTDEQKALATYKMAWSYLNLNKYSDAENYFLFLIGKAWAKGFADDSLKDLAYVVTLHRDEFQILEYSAKIFKSNKVMRADFLIHVFRYFYQQSIVKKKPLILQEILNLETRPEKKISVLVLSLRSQQRGYASLEPIQELRKIKVVLFESKLRPESEQFKEVSGELEIELVNLIKSFVDTFSGKTKTPENLTREVVANNLTDLLEFHNTYFYTSNERIKTLGVWLDLCQELKKPDCSYKVSKIILAEEKLSNLHAKAFKDYIVALNLLSAEKPEYRVELMDNLKRYVLDDKKELEADWLPYAKRYTVLLNDEKKYSDSIPILSKIYEKEKSTESLFRLQWTRFQNGLYQDIVNVQFTSKSQDQFVKDIQEIVRESHLKLAETAAKNDSFDDYERNIKKFISTQPDSKKALVAQLDFLNKVFEKKNYDKLNVELSAIELQQRISPSYIDIFSKTIVRYIQDAKFQEALELMKGYKLGQNKDLDVHYLYLSLIVNQKLSSDEILKITTMPAQVKKTMINTIALYLPDLLIQNYKLFKPTDVELKKSVLLAFQIKSEKYEVSLDKNAKTYLNEILPTELKNIDTTTVEKNLMALEFPGYDIGMTKLATATQKLVNKVRDSRKLVIKELDGKSISVKSRILVKAMEIEKKMGVFIEMSPAPDGYSPEQLTEYQNGLKEVAKEFYTQYEEYKKINEALDEQLTQASVAPLNVLQLDSYKWSSSPAVEIVKKLVATQNYIGASVLSDYRKSVGDITDAVFYQLRSYVLLKYQGSNLMMNYVLAELKASTQDELIAFLQGK